MMCRGDVEVRNGKKEDVKKKSQKEKKIEDCWTRGDERGREGGG